MGGVLRRWFGIGWAVTCLGAFACSSDGAQVGNAGDPLQTPGLDVEIGGGTDGLVGGLDDVESADPDGLDDLIETNESSDSSGDADGPDSSLDTSAAPPAIEAEADTWTWIPVPESQCADGSSTGLGVNLHPGAELAVIYLEGGGACWDYATCFGVVNTSFHLGGYDEGSFFSNFTGVYLSSLFFDRESNKSPTPDAHYIFVPYCTGDVHAGDAVVDMEGLLPWQDGTMHFRGAHNMERYLELLAPTLADVERILVVGASAGGFGALFSWPRIQAAFPGKRVDVIDDSGAPVAMSQERWAMWRDTWNMKLADDCGGCLSSIGAATQWALDNVLPGNRLALISHQRDTIIATFMGMLPGQYADLLGELGEVLDGEDEAHYFFLPGLQHTPTLLSFEMGAEVDDVPLWQWLQRMVNDDPAWMSHAP